MKIHGFQIDVARQIERPAVLRSLVPVLAERGYNVLMLYIEDAYAFPRHPGVARRHAYSVECMQELQRDCAARGLELIPVFPALGHCSYITSKPGYEKYDEGRGTGQCCGTVSPSFPETYELLEELFADWCLHIPGTYLHVSLDESTSMGQYHLRTHGPGSLEAAAMFADHANRLAAIARKLGRRLLMWADMLYYLPQAIPRLDRDIIMTDWYYYVFPRQPRVETFNFAEIDSAGLLKRAGFDVWASPSVWPNKPFPDVAERWGNLASWQRYGAATGIDGIINTDWENSFGFGHSVELLIRLFHRLAQAPAPADLNRGLCEVLRAEYGIPADARLAADILALGKFHLDGRNVGRYLHRPLTAWLSGNEHDTNARYAAELDAMFADIAGLAARTTMTAGRDLLEDIRLAWTTCRLYWTLRARLPESVHELAAGTAESRARCAAAFAAWADAFDRFRTDYETFWERVRYADDPKPLVRWAEATAATLRTWAAAALADSADHPVLSTYRLETRLCCRHPALPIARAAITWPDGATQAESEVIIHFESAFAQPAAESEEPSCFPLAHNAWPAEVRWTSVHYGEVGIREVAVVRGTERRVYRLAGLEGKHARTEGDTAWIGPHGATVADPLERIDRDTAMFRLEGPTAR